jgi:molybdate transport system ATP-binding protein
VVARVSLHAELGVRRNGFTLAAKLDAASDETVVLLGPNGAGKSTALAAIAGTVTLTDGHITLDGETFDDPATKTWVPPERRAVGMLFQDALLFPHLSATDNVAFGLRCRGVARADARRRAHESLERVGLDAHGQQARPSELSGGQAQRVALARALVTAPRVLLLDEPLSALDASTRRDLRRDLSRHLAAFAGPRIVVTHDALEAMLLADRLVVLEDGVVRQVGAPAELRARPRTRYVADVVGMNLFHGRADRGSVRLIGGGELIMAATEPSGDVVVVVPPRAVALHRRQPEGTPRNVWPGTIEHVDDEGDRVRVQVSGLVPLIAEVTAAAVAELRLHDRAPVWVSVKATEIDVFPA